MLFRSPTLTAIGNKSVNSNSTLSFTISGSDPDGDALTYSASGLPSGATFNASTRQFSWTPSSAQAGNYSVTFTVSDGSLSTSETITITVGNVNRPPVLNAIGSKSVNENVALDFTVSGSDPDGNPLTYSATGLPAGSTFNGTSGAFSWTPSYSQAGSYNVTFTVSDGSLTASETITITVNNVNRPPVLNAIGAKSVSENQTLSFTISGSDPDGDAITFSATGLPTGASFDSGTRTFTWTPTFTQASTYNVSFTVSDGNLTASEVVTITVAHVNRAPVMTVPGPQTVVAGQPLTFSVSATDPDGDPLTFGATGLPSGATFDTGTRQFTWTPIDSQAGSVSVTFTASDGQLTSSGNVAITVTATATTNSPPALALPDSLNGAATFALSSTITATDPDGEDRKSTRLNSVTRSSRMPSSA